MNTASSDMEIKKTPELRCVCWDQRTGQCCPDSTNADRAEHPVSDVPKVEKSLWTPTHAYEGHTTQSTHNDLRAICTRVFPSQEVM